MKNHKYIFVTGGVMSGVGKGVAASSIGAIFKARGFGVNSDISRKPHSGAESFFLYHAGVLLVFYESFCRYTKSQTLLDRIE